MIPFKCPYHELCDAHSGLDEKEKYKYSMKNCFKKRYMKYKEYSAKFFNDFFDSISKADPERIRNFTKSVGAVVLEKIVKSLARDN